MSLALFSSEVCRACVERGAYFIVENPASSRLWESPPIADIMQQPEVCDVVFHACQFGSSSLKPTRLAGTLPGLSSMGLRCQGGHEHVVLQGCVKVEMVGVRDG